MSSPVSSSSTVNNDCEQISGEQFAHEPGHDECMKATVTATGTGSQCYIQSNKLCTDRPIPNRTTGGGDHNELQDKNNECGQEDGYMVSSSGGTEQARIG